MPSPTLKNKDYDYMVKKATPNTKSAKNISAAFLVGGAICALGELMGYLYREKVGLPEDIVPTAVSITLVGLSILLTALNVYDNLAKFAGAGTLVPITGFANAMSSAALEFKSEGLVLGVGAKMFIIAGPVIVYGVVASVLYGLVIFALGLY
jgi:stage V sporulation protein AC